uniref:Malectin-like domain-containing protein n=1 Tax=Fagus sylvatica TaxID=28930 RepID=A0A2N9GDN1_FAGSY
MHIHELLSTTLFHPQIAITIEELAALTNMDMLYSHKIRFQLCLLLPLHFSSLLLLSLADNTYPVKYLINCGANSNVTFNNGVFVADINSPSFSTGESEQVNNFSTSIPLLYRTARVYRMPSSYGFEIDQESIYIVRLHFFAFLSRANLYDALFNVSASGFSLLTNFSIGNGTSSPVIKEFLLTIPQGEFRIHFIPSQQSSLAFINAIEVFLANETRITDDVFHVTSAGYNASQELKLLENQLTAIKRAEERKTCKRQESDRSGHRFGAGLGGSDAFWPARAWCWATLRGLHPQDSRRTPVHDEVLICIYSGLLSQALHTICGITFGGSPIEFDELWRSWVNDDSYLILNRGSAMNCTIYGQSPNYNHESVSNYTATDHIYQSCKQLKPDSDGNSSLLNLTWRFPVSKNTEHFVRFHFCDIVSKTAADLQFNLSIYSNYNKTIYPYFKTPDLASPFFIEYVVDSDDSGFTNFSISPSEQYSSILNAFLNGLEIMEFLNKSLVALRLKCTKAESDQSLGGLLYGGRLTEGSATGSPPSSLNLSLRISFAEIQYATKKFNAKLLIGEGGFGKVYKGTFRNGMKWL